MENLPLISIVIPVYNGSDFVGEAIESALGQTWPRKEIIVVNDGSTDDTEGICLAYGDRIRYFRKENGGQSTALNMGIGEMRGEYFSWLSHDDLYYPGKLESQVAVALAHPGAVIYSDWVKIDEQGRTIGEVVIGEVPPQDFRHMLMTRNLAYGCSFLVPAEAFLQYGLFDVSIPLTSDVDMWFRLAKHFDFIHIPGIHTAARVHGAQASVRKYRAHQKESDAFYLRCFMTLRDEGWFIRERRQDALNGLAALALNFAAREYILASREVTREIGRLAGCPAAWRSRLACSWRYLLKRGRNFLKYSVIQRLG